jgi:alpha-N-arabinofuranosidase
MPEEWHRMLALQKRKCMIYSLKEKEGMLRLYPRKESIAEAAYCSYLGLRQKSYRFEAETGVFFVPENEKETAGLVLYQNHENHLRMEIAKKQEQKVFRVVTCIKGTETKAAGIRDFSAVFPDEYTYRGIP